MAGAAYGDFPLERLYHMIGDTAYRSLFNRGLRSVVTNQEGPPIGQLAPPRFMTLVAQNETGFPQTATPFVNDKPMLIWPMARNATVKAPAVDNFLTALPTELIDPSAGQIPPTTITPAHSSVNGGALYLPPGRWYLYYPDAGLNIRCFAFQCDPMLAAMMLARPGNHSTSGHPNEITVDGAGAGTFIWTGRANRKAMFLQCTNSSVGVRLGIGFDATATRGLRLPANQWPPFTLAGSSLACEYIHAFAEDPAGSTVSLIELV